MSLKSCVSLNCKLMHVQRYESAIIERGGEEIVVYVKIMRKFYKNDYAVRVMV